MDSINEQKAAMKEIFDLARAENAENAAQATANLQFLQFILIAIAVTICLILITQLVAKVLDAKRIADDYIGTANPPGYLGVNVNNEWEIGKPSRRSTWWKIFWSEF